MKSRNLTLRLRPKFAAAVFGPPKVLWAAVFAASFAWNLASGATPLRVPEWLTPAVNASDESTNATARALDVSYRTSVEPKSVVEHYHEQLKRRGIEAQTNFDGLATVIFVTHERLSCLVRVALDDGRAPFSDKSFVRVSCSLLEPLPIGSNPTPPGTGEKDSKSSEPVPRTPPQQLPQGQARPVPTAMHAKAVAKPAKSESLSFEVLMSCRFRYDGALTYYVLVPAPDLATSRFKADIKRVVTAIVAQKGPKVSASIFDNRLVLERAYLDDCSPRKSLPSKERLDFEGRHLIAMFDGQLRTGLYFNTLSFYPGASTSTPAVGRHVDTEQFNPRADFTK